MTKSRILCLGLVLTLDFLSAAAGEEIGQRPYELQWAGRLDDTRAPLIDFENLTGWTTSVQNAVAEFVPSREQQLWGDQVGKLTYRGLGSGPVVTLSPPQPISLSPPFDCVNLWVYGNNWGWAPDRLTPQVEIRVLLQGQNDEVISIGLGRVGWQEWWLMHARLSQAQLAALGDHPSLLRLEVREGRNKDNRTLYFDNLAIYTEPLRPLTFAPRPRRALELPPGQTVGNNVGPGTLPFPTRAETILPDNLATGYQVTVETVDDEFLFQYSGDDGALEYRYRPESGTLSDVTAQWLDRSERLHPLHGGQLLFAGQTAQDPQMATSRSLLRCEREGDAVHAVWQYRLGDRVAEVHYVFRLWQKSLVVDTYCEGGEIGELRLGRVVGAAEPRLVTLPYLTGAEQRPAVLVSGASDRPLFVSALLDHCRSNASLFWFTNQLAGDGVAINGGARYLPRTDAVRNSCYERIFLTVSPHFVEVLPNVPNPRSPWMHVAGERLWRAHGASDRDHDYEYWKRIARYGMTKVVITDHETGWRDGGESFTMRTRAAPGKGGDQGQADYSRKLRALGLRYGIYNNYTDYAPVNEFWDEDYVTRTPDNQWQTAWPRCYNPKPARAVEMEARLAPIIQQKYQLDTAYCDVHTAVRPWSYVDYDARVPGAGTFAATFYAYGEIMLHQKATWNGPVYSEGNNHWYYCGLTDGNYGQDQVGQLATSPWLVDFDLRKLHPLCCNFGMGSPSMFFGNESLTAGTRDEQQQKLDRFLAATLAFGHTGFLVLEGGMTNAVQSYYALQQVHAHYAQQKVQSICYADPQGKLLDTDQAVATGHYVRSQIATRYDNGLEVFVNGHATDTWVLPDITLPPNGWFVRDFLERRLTALSAIVDGHRADYVDSPAYVYANGRGLLTRFPRATCDGQLIANWQPDGTIEVIPAGECHVMGIELRGRSATAVALDEARTPLGPAEVRYSRGLVYVMPVSDAFSYLLTPADPLAAPLQCDRVKVIPGETVRVEGADPAQYRIPADAPVGGQQWLEAQGKWLDFSVVPMAHAELTLGEDDYQLHVHAGTDEAIDAVVQFQDQSRHVQLVPGQLVELSFPRSPARDESIQEIPLLISAGDLSFRKTWWSNSQYDTQLFASITGHADAGQQLRGQDVLALNERTGAGVYWTERSCNDEMRRCLFMHPPYQEGVGNCFALLQPLDLPKTPAAFRCDIGKADGSDLGDGILFLVSVVDAQGKTIELARQLCAQHVWMPLQVDLSPWRGQRISLRLIADVGSGDNPTGDWACWSNLRIESLKPVLVTTIHDQYAELAREPGPFSVDNLTLDGLRQATSGILHFRGMGLQHATPYISTVQLNGILLGELPAAAGNESKGIWSDAQVELTPEAIAALDQFNTVVIQNPGQDSFKVGRFWLELALPDGRRTSSQITRAVFTQPPGWPYGEGISVPFDKDIRATIRIPLPMSSQ